jgi:hypothetical protein
MANSFNCGPALFEDGTTWTALIGRQYDSGTAVLDSGLSASAVTPAGGVYPALSATLQVTAPASGLSVNVSAGYCMVPATAAQGGGYRFGLMTSGSLTVASNATGSTRQDYVIANVQDLGNSGSFAQIEYVTGTTSAPALPVNSIVLAQVSVPNAASSIVAGNITDLRGFVCAPGGILFIPAETDAPAAPVSQIMWEADTGGLVQGSGIAGSVLPVSLAGGAAAPAPPVVTTYSVAGTYTYNAPAGATTGFVETWGAGGAGGQESGFSGAAGAGGGGEYSAEPQFTLQPGGSYTVVVGHGGAGGSPEDDPNGNPGTSSSFAGTVTAHGGAGGHAYNGSSAAGGLGGTGSTASVHYPGGKGGSGGNSPDAAGGGGGGGGSGGSAGPGNAGPAGTLTGAGAGAAAVTGGGPGGTGGGTASPGKASAPPSGPGGGSGGTGSGANDTVTSQPPGADGQVRITTSVAAGASALDYVPHLTTTSDGITVAQVALSADGSTNFEIAYQREPTAGGPVRQSWLRLYVDNVLLDTTYARDTATIAGRISATIYTSRAQATTPSKGIHTVKLTGSAATAAYTLRATPVLT